MKKQPVVITPIQIEYFIDMMVAWAAPVAKANDLPAAAMVACAIMESGYGTSDIYKITGSPFNLQKPDWYKWVNCKTKWVVTGTKTDSKGKVIQTMRAPFCLAKGDTDGLKLADAARIWCEWVLGWPQKGVNASMRSFRHNPEKFALNLPLLGFGEQEKRDQNGKAFLNALQTHSLVGRCS